MWGLFLALVLWTPAPPISSSEWVAWIVSKPLAHDFHTSIAEMDYNPRSQAFEVSLRVFVDDFEKALTLLTFQEKFRQLLPEKLAKVVVPTQPDEMKQYVEQIIRLDPKTKDFYPLIQAYLAQRFVLQIPKGETAPILFYGMEQGNETDVLWLYFEVDCSKMDVPKAQFSNRVLLELFDDQTNIVNMSYQGKKKSFLFQFGQEQFAMGL